MSEPVCPDDLGGLEQIGAQLRCVRCGREFPLTDGLLELLPKESFQDSAAEYRQLAAYASSFSARREKSWLQPLRVIRARLGNGYLYSWAARSAEALAEGRSLRILDAACGDGVLRDFLSSRHPYAGVDFSVRLLRRAQRHYPAAYFRADLNHLPFRSHCFDMVVSLQALQYLDRPVLALDQMARVLKPGGRLLLTVPNAESFKYRLQGRPQIQLQQFDRAELRALLDGAFEIIDLKAQGLWFPFPKISVHLPGVYPARWGLSWTIIAKPKPRSELPPGR